MRYYQANKVLRGDCQPVLVTFNKYARRQVKTILCECDEQRPAVTVRELLTAAGVNVFHLCAPCAALNDGAA